MRIVSVKANAFGPFTGDTLELSPGMNVIYGPNESGKSSWHAAIYAALCGIKRTRGQPSREDRTFASRHRPWRGTTWRVTAVIGLDDGRTIEIEQVLGSGGRSVAIETRTKKPLDDILRAGTVDASTLLGLTRESALATVFLRQADVLRVLTDAGALQEYLERAAATSTADTTADEALARITAFKRERVGLLRAGSRGPLAAASGQLKDATDTLDRAEDYYESYQELLARRQAAETEAREIERRLREVVHHEHDRQRQERWQEIWAAERRLGQAHRLIDESTSGPHGSHPAKELVTAVTLALAAFESRPAKPGPLQGSSVEELERELAEMPDMPSGDLEPARDVTRPLDRWRTERERLAAHNENEPALGQTDTPPIPPSELRRLADELELPVPEVDRALVDELNRWRGVGSPTTPPPAPKFEPSSAIPSAIPIAIGGFVALVGMMLAGFGQLRIGAVALLVGVIVATLGVVSRFRAKTPTIPPRSPVSLPEATAFQIAGLEFNRLEARLAFQEEAQAQAQRRRQGAIARIAELGLPAATSALQQLAAEGDRAASRHGSHVEWERRQGELEERWSIAARDLQVALSARGVQTDEDVNLEQAFEEYLQACRRRSGLARHAGRRPDLEGQIVNRRSIEASRHQNAVVRATAAQQLLHVAKEAGCEAPIDNLTDVLRDWVCSQEQLDEARHRQGKTAARLDQLLDGRALEELEVEFTEMRAHAGDPPPEDAPALPDRSAELEALQVRVRQQRDVLAELVGQLEGAESHLLDVSRAVEAEARADAEVRRLTALAEDLDIASEILGAAQQEVHADIAPVLNETIRPWVPRITCGRYDDIRVNPATLELEAHEAGGRFRAVTVLSHGTTEQLFLLLRLALAQRLTTTGEQAPIVLDDITVQSDSDRTLAALDLLHELSADHQVVLFSQEDEVMQWAENRLVIPVDRLIRLTGPAMTTVGSPY